MLDYQSTGDASQAADTMQVVTSAIRRLPRGTSSHPIIQPGRNAWRAGVADKAAFLVDGAAYFSALDQALRQARHEIWIVGWDFNPDIRLKPHLGSQTLGELLLSMVEENPQLQVRILVWGMGPIYSGRSLRLFRPSAVSIHPRISMRFDFRHPLRGCHHQKLVSIDGNLAFLGGIDLTARRWDEPDHETANPLRCSPDGTPYEPVHDIQCAVSGEVALMIGDVARRRWKKATGEIVAPMAHPRACWPALVPDMVATPAAIALTEPGLIGKRGRYEAFRLTRDAIAAAGKHIYIETQYLASFGVARAIAKRLKDPDGPEIAVVVTKSSHGFIEKLAMGNNRDRLIRRLKRVDRYDRLRVMYAVIQNADGGEQDLVVHSKLIIVDDRFVRIGSSNLNNRSEGLDTECDLALEADCDEHQRAISCLRHRLIAEHLGTSPALVAETEVSRQSMLAMIAALNRGARGLRQFEINIHRGDTPPFLGTALVDPRHPYWPLQKLRLRLGRLLSALL
ncbi:phospholipase D-like domain-containing protein (plasmid) [Rhizobium sp. T1470]|uniref:phospholipase D-like domain-containing protein n=1 Tax=unclassified Rhizobium TaxID=2613769 RepID=UPI001AAF7AD4|nr:phospholipase D-like domain-containing protein [Rhizobium sp. T1473]MCA0805739.1 phospholipase D-like domain-containing protein [Rhizobium sp. T1473]